MTNTAIPAQRSALAFFALWLFTSLFIALVPTRHLTPDAANNLMYVANHDRYELWHGQHLLALWPGYLTAQITGNAYSGMRLAHAILAGATVVLLFLTLLRLVRSWRIAVPVALALVCSYGFWHFASDPDIYMAGYASVALLLLAFVHALQYPGTRSIVWLGLAAALAILCHQMNIELAGLIGLVLVGLALRPTRIPVRWSHVVLYGVLSLGPTLLLYFVGWLDVSAWLTSKGELSPGFADWALRYFGTASSGEATWGVTLSPTTLPIAAYAFIQSWILPPQPRDALALVVIALLGVGAVIVALRGLLLVRIFSTVERIVALVCVLSLLANAISAWWWQAGNIKFYLFMQLYVLLLVAIIARAGLASKARTLIAAGLGALGSGLLLAMLLFTLPYETQGGVFRLVDLYGDKPMTNLYVQDNTQEAVIDYISKRTARLLTADWCIELPSFQQQHPDETRIWVLSEAWATDCHLDGATLVDRYTADRTRTVWQVWDVTAITTNSLNGN
jgi:hypothetical protein